MVYVDDMYKLPLGEFGRMKMSHMIADTKEELLAMCDKIGVQRKWIQDEGEYSEHFDIAMAKRALAIKFGAKEVTCHQLAEMLMGRHKTGSLGPLPAQSIN